MAAPRRRQAFRSVRDHGDACSGVRATGYQIRIVRQHVTPANRNVLVIGMNLDKLKTTGGVDVRGKRVIVRADFNVPVKDGKVTDAARIERVLPGLKALADRGAKVVVVSHFGRPKGGPQPDLSLKPVAEALQGLLGLPRVRRRLHRRESRDDRRIAQQWRYRRARKSPLP